MTCELSSTLMERCDGIVLIHVTVGWSIYEYIKGLFMAIVTNAEEV
jgi:hypothetical protein